MKPLMFKCAELLRPGRDNEGDQGLDRPGHHRSGRVRPQAAIWCVAPRRPSGGQQVAAVRYSGPNGRWAARYAGVLAYSRPRPCGCARPAPRPPGRGLPDRGRAALRALAGTRPPGTHTIMVDSVEHLDPSTRSGPGHPTIRVCLELKCLAPLAHFRLVHIGPGAHPCTTPASQCIARSTRPARFQLAG